MWFRKISGTVLALGLVLAACQSASPSQSGSASQAPESQAPDVPQVLRVSIGTEPPSLDPTQATDSESIAVLRSVTYPLAYFNADLDVVPGMATDWDVSADGMTITFNLGDFAYSNGDPVVAADFVYAWRRLADPREAAGYGYVLTPVVGYSDISAIDTSTASDADIETALDTLGVAAPDEKTFVVTLASPATYFVYIATLWVTVPQQEGWQFTEAEGYVASGPMMISEWNHNANVVLTPNPEWTGEPATIEEIQISIIDDPTANLAAYENDELDISAVPSAETGRIQEDPILSGQVLEGAVLVLTYFGFDMKDPEGPFARSKNLRRAFAQAVDKETMIATVFGGAGTKADGLVPPGMPGYQEGIGPQFDLAQAAIDFQAGLDELGITAADLDLEIGFNSGAGWEPRVDFLIEGWRQAFGDEVTMTPVGMEFGAYLDRLSQDPFDIFRLGWGADFPHPHNFLYDLLACGSGNNNQFWCNEDFMALVNQAAVAPTLVEQVPLYNAAQELAMEESPMIPIRFSNRFTLVKPWIQNLVATSQDSNTGELFWAWVTISSH